LETGLWVNTDICLEVMESTALPWIKTVAGDRPWVWPQDPAPCHVSNRSTKWLKDDCYDLVSKDCWPPSSLDLNPLDYFVWGYLETHTNRRAHTNKASLIISIKENFASMDKAMMAKDCVAFRGRVEAVMEGGFFESNVKTTHKRTFCFLFQINRLKNECCMCFLSTKYNLS
jgi:hypothetical protein